MTLLGAAMILLSGFCAGAIAARELSSDVQKTEDMLRVAERMRVLIVLRRLTLPTASESLAKEFPAYFSAAAEAVRRFDTLSFGELWTAVIRSISLPKDTEMTMTALGCELSAGEEPEIAFEIALCELREQGRLRRINKSERSGVYVALGTSGAALLTLLLW